MKLHLALLTFKGIHKAHQPGVTRVLVLCRPAVVLR